MWRIAFIFAVCVSACAHPPSDPRSVIERASEKLASRAHAMADGCGDACDYAELLPMVIRACDLGGGRGCYYAGNLLTKEHDPIASQFLLEACVRGFHEYCNAFDYQAIDYTYAKEDAVPYEREERRRGPPRPGKHESWIDSTLALSAGVVQPTAAHADFSPSAVVMLSGAIEIDAFALRVGTGGMFPVSDSGLSLKGWLLEMGLVYYLLDAAFSPYAIAGVSPRVVAIDHVRFGFAPFAGVGAYFSDDALAVSLEARATQNILPLDSRFPLELGGYAGLHW